MDKGCVRVLDRRTCYLGHQQICIGYFGLYRDRSTPDAQRCGSVFQPGSSRGEEATWSKV